MILLFLIIAAFAALYLLPRRSRPEPRDAHETRTVTDPPAPPQRVITGRCWVVDGDTIIIGKERIRLFGIDAPELEHPYGQKSKWAMVRLCKGQVIRAETVGELSYERHVAICTLPDGRDLSAELVKQGLALDWPKFSGGRYAELEPDGVRKRLWCAANRQTGGYFPPTGSART